MCIRDRQSDRANDRTDELMCAFVVFCFFNAETGRIGPTPVPGGFNGAELRRAPCLCRTVEWVDIDCCDDGLGWIRLGWVELGLAGLCRVRSGWVGSS